MPDTRSHRGRHPDDARDFEPQRHENLREATFDLSWLLGRGYSEVAALKLVGDRLQLTARQRQAVMRGAASDEACERRRRRRLAPAQLRGSTLGIDTFNCLITLEASFSGALVLTGRDGALRDISSVHGTYRRVEETSEALSQMRRALTALSIGGARFYIDRPVGNSGRLRGWIETGFADAPFAVEALVLDDVDRRLIADEACVASSDSFILDHANAWFDLPAHVLASCGAPVFALDLR